MSDTTSRNMLNQIYPGGQIDPNKSVTDNMYDLTGYTNPSEGSPQALAYSNSLSGSAFIESQLQDRQRNTG